MPNCSAFGCTNRSSDNPDLSFHRIPSEKKNDLRKKWLQNIRREGSLPKDAVVCSIHFDSNCFVRDLQVSYNNLGISVFYSYKIFL